LRLLDVDIATAQQLIESGALPAKKTA
jgi:hypothetical protein